MRDVHGHPFVLVHQSPSGVAAKRAVPFPNSVPSCLFLCFEQIALIGYLGRG